MVGSLQYHCGRKPGAFYYCRYFGLSRTLETTASLRIHYTAHSSRCLFYLFYQKSDPGWHNLVMLHSKVNIGNIYDVAGSGIGSQGRWNTSVTRTAADVADSMPRTGGKLRQVEHIPSQERR